MPELVVSARLRRALEGVAAEPAADGAGGAEADPRAEARRVLARLPADAAGATGAWGGRGRRERGAWASAERVRSGAERRTWAAAGGRTWQRCAWPVWMRGAG
jgi:hypothetical protein